MRLLSLLALALTLAAVGEAAPPRDRKPPTTPTVDGDQATPDLRPTFHFGATDNRSTRAQLRFRCAIDSTVMRPCARIYRPPSALSFAAHVLRVRVLDRAGNPSRVAVFAFTVVGRWDAASDFAKAPRPENPGRDRYGNTAWFYLYSGTTAHNPSDYRALPTFFRSDPNFQVWRSTEAPFPNGAFVGWSGDQITFGPGHYNLGQNAILGWRSPVATSITIQASVWHNQTPCGVHQDGIIWAIDRGADSLRSGRLAPGERTSFEMTMPIGAGESLYLIVDGGADTNCDGTLVDMNIETRTK